MTAATLVEMNATEHAGVTIGIVDDDGPLHIPVNYRRIKTDKQDIPVETLHGWIRREKLALQPEFQRNFVWNATKASRLVESLLLDIPLPVVYVAEEADRTYAVVDGQQRLTSLSAFIDGTFPDGRPFRLSGLQVLTELRGKGFTDLARDLQETILNTPLRLIIIQQGSHPDVKFEVFERLNVGSEKLNEQELRNSVYRGRYNALLLELAHNPHLLKVLGASQPHPRMVDRQMLLRFFAMWRKGHHNYSPVMKQFLNREIELHRNPSDEALEEMRSVFERAIESAYAVFGKQAFRRFNVGGLGQPDGGWETRRLNLALWDTLLYSFSHFDQAQLIPIADSIREEFLDVMTNDALFVEYVTSSTDNLDRIIYRADVWLERMRTLVGSVETEPHHFSLTRKQRLFEADPICQICDQTIRGVDDAAVVDVRHYWRGGSTIPDDARFAHRCCNRAPGRRD